MFLRSLLLVLVIINFSNAKSHKAKKIADKTIHFSDGTIKKGGHRNWRNNNPGNLEYGKFAREHGAIGTDGRFAIFPSMNKGYIAHVALLSGDKYKHLTLTKALKRFAPSFENNTKRYLNYLKKNTGIRSSQKLKYLSWGKKVELVKYMAKFEGMKRGAHYKSNVRFSKTKDISGKYYYAKVKRSSPQSRKIQKYAMKETKRRFNRILNPKKTRLHNILLSN